MLTRAAAAATRGKSVLAPALITKIASDLALLSHQGGARREVSATAVLLKGRRAGSKALVDPPKRYRPEKARAKLRAKQLKEKIHGEPGRALKERRESAQLEASSAAREAAEDPAEAAASAARWAAIREEFEGPAVPQELGGWTNLRSLDVDALAEELAAAEEGSAAGPAAESRSHRARRGGSILSSPSAGEATVAPELASVAGSDAAPGGDAVAVAGTAREADTGFLELPQPLPTASLPLPVEPARPDVQSQRLLKGYTLLIRALSAQGRYDEALGAAERLQHAGVTPDLRVYTALLHGAALSRDGAAATAAWWAIRKSGHLPDAVAWSAYVHAMARCGRIDDALRVAEAMRAAGFPWRLEVYTSVLAGLVGKGRTKEAWEHWRTMRREGLEPDVMSFTTMMRACARDGEYERAMMLMEDMSNAGQQPTLGTFHCLLAAAAAAPQWIQAYGEAVPQLERRILGYGFRPNEETWRLLVHAYGRGGDADNVARCVAMLRRWQWGLGLPPGTAVRASQAAPDPDVDPAYVTNALQRQRLALADKNAPQLHASFPSTPWELRGGLFTGEEALAAALFGGGGGGGELPEPPRGLKASTYATILAAYARCQSVGTKWGTRPRHGLLSAPPPPSGDVVQVSVPAARRLENMRLAGLEYELDREAPDELRRKMGPGGGRSGGRLKHPRPLPDDGYSDDDEARREYMVALAATLEEEGYRKQAGAVRLQLAERDRRERESEAAVAIADEELGAFGAGRSDRAVLAALRSGAAARAVAAEDEEEELRALEASQRSLRRSSSAAAATLPQRGGGGRALASRGDDASAGGLAETAAGERDISGESAVSEPASTSISPRRAAFLAAGGRRPPVSAALRAQQAAAAAAANGGVAIEKSARINEADADSEADETAAFLRDYGKALGMSAEGLAQARAAGDGSHRRDRRSSSAMAAAADGFGAHENRNLLSGREKRAVEQRAATAGALEAPRLPSWREGGEYEEDDEEEEEEIDETIHRRAASRREQHGAEDAAARKERHSRALVHVEDQGSHGSGSLGGGGRNDGGDGALSGSQRREFALAGEESSNPLVLPPPRHLMILPTHARQGELLRRARSCFDEAVRAAARQNRPPEPPLLRGMLSVLAEAKKAGAAEQFLEEEFAAARAEPNVTTARALVRMYLRLRDFEQAEDVERRSRESWGLPPDRQCLGMLVQAYAMRRRSKDMDRILRLAADLGAPPPERFLRAFARPLAAAAAEAAAGAADGAVVSGSGHPHLPADPSAAARELQRRVAARKGVWQNVRRVQRRSIDGGKGSVRVHRAGA